MAPLRRLNLLLKVAFGLTDLETSDFFKIALLSTTRDTFTSCLRSVVTLLFDQTFSMCTNTWNNLPGSVDFSSLTSFVCTVKLADLSKYLRYF